MMPRRNQAIDYESCIAFYLDALEATRARDVEAWLRMHPELARRARLDAQAQRQVNRYFAPVLEDPIPPRLVAAAQPAGSRWTGYIALAASIVLSTTAGWWLGATMHTDHPSRTRSASSHLIAPLGRQRSPQPVAATVATTTTIPHPDFSSQGYRLIAVKPIRQGNQMQVEFLYQNNHGKQVTVYAQPRSAQPGKHPRLYLHDGLLRIRWQHAGINYSLSGNMSPASLEALARHSFRTEPDKPSHDSKAHVSSPKSPRDRQHNPSVTTAADQQTST